MDFVIVIVIVFIFIRMRFQTGTEELKIFTNLMFGWQNFFKNDGSMLGGGEEAFDVVRDGGGTNSNVSTSVKRNYGLYGAGYQKLKSAIESKILAPSGNMRGSQWGFHSFKYFNLVSSLSGSGDEALTKIVSGPEEEDEEEKAFEFRKRAERPKPNLWSIDTILQGKRKSEEPPSVKEEHRQAKVRLMTSQHASTSKGKHRAAKNLVSYTLLNLTGD